MNASNVTVTAHDFKLSMLNRAITRGRLTSKGEQLAQELAGVHEQINKVKGCKGAAKAASMRKLATVLRVCDQRALYHTIVNEFYDGAFATGFFDACQQLDDAAEGLNKARVPFKQTFCGMLILAARVGAKLRRKHLGLNMFINDIDGVSTLDERLFKTLDTWAEFDSRMETACSYSKGTFFANAWDGRKAIINIATEADARLGNSEDDFGALDTIPAFADEYCVREYMAASGYSNEEIVDACRAVAKGNSQDIYTADHAVVGESGEGCPMPTASRNGAEPIILWHKPANVEDLRTLLTDPDVVAQLLSTGAFEFASLLASKYAKHPLFYSADYGSSMLNSDGTPRGPFSAVRTMYSKLAILAYQASQDVVVRRELTTTGARGERLFQEDVMTVADRANFQYQCALDAHQDLSTDISRVEETYQKWCVELPTMLNNDQMPATLERAHELMLKAMPSEISGGICGYLLGAAMLRIDVAEARGLGLDVFPVTDAEGNAVNVERQNNPGVYDELLWVATKAGFDASGVWASFVTKNREKVRKADDRGASRSHFDTQNASMFDELLARF